MSNLTAHSPSTSLRIVRGAESEKRKDHCLSRSSQRTQSLFRVCFAFSPLCPFWPARQKRIPSGVKDAGYWPNALTDDQGVFSFLFPTILWSIVYWSRPFYDLSRHYCVSWCKGFSAPCYTISGNVFFYLAVGNPRYSFIVPRASCINSYPLWFNQGLLHNQTQRTRKGELGEPISV